MIYYDQTYCEWIDVDSIMSNMTMEYNPVRIIHFLDPIDAKKLR